MSSSLTKKQKNDIRKSLPLKIFERRESAADLARTIEYFNDMRSNLMMIGEPSDDAAIKLSWTDPFGEKMTASCGLPGSFFNKFKNDLADVAKHTIDVCTKKLDDIPNAKIIPFDFRNRQVEQGRQLHPNPPPPKKELETILKGGTEISEAAGIDYNEIKFCVDEKGLPAFKIPGRKFWFAFPEDIEKWKKEQEGPK